MEDLVGTLVSGYRLEAAIGSGGMGAVFRARQERNQRAVALKLVHLELVKDARCRIRFLREAQLAARLDHPHVVRVYDCGRWGDEQGGLYMAMELVEGISVEDLCRAGVPPRVACGLIHQALDALGHVHARDIIHRDIKPENLLVTRDREGWLRLVITDFGIAAAVGENPSTRLTEEGTVLGTPAYMSPEHARGLSLSGPGVDLYPMGVILYRLLTGRLPFSGPPVRVLMAKNQRDPAWPSTGRGADLPEALQQVVLKLMARNPEDRYPLAPDARRALRPWAERPRLDDESWASMARVPADGSQTRPFPSPAPRAAEEAPPASPPRPVREGPAPASRAAAAPAHGAPEPVPPPSPPPPAPRPQGPEVTAEPPPVDVSRLWGRRRELDTLEAVAAEVERGRGRAVIVRGDVGIGKSALVEAFAEGLAEQGRFVVIRHRSVAVSAGVAEALDRWLGTVGRGPDEVAAAAREFLRQNGESDAAEVDRTVALLRPGSRQGKGMGDADPVWRERAACALTARVLRRLASRRPVALVVEDLHIAGPAAAALLAHLLFEVEYEPFPLLYLGTWRPGAEQPGFLAKLAESDRHEGWTRLTLDLEPLPQGELAQGLAEHNGLPWPEALRIATASGGNPLFAGLLAETSGPDEEPQPGDAASALLAAHLGRRLAPLPALPEAQRLLEALAVLGDRVELGLLQSVLSDGGTQRVDRSVDDLVAAGVVGVQEGNGPQALALTHALHRPILLEKLSPARQRRLHRRAAEILIARAEQGVPLAAGRAGEHLHRAGLHAEAVPFLLAAIDEDLAFADPASAAAHARAVLELLPPDDPRRGDVAVRLGRLLARVGDGFSAERVLRPLAQGGAPDTALPAGEVLARLLLARGDRIGTGEILAGIAPLAERAGAAAKRALHRARRALMQAEGDFEGALREARSAIAGAEGVERLDASRCLAVAALLAGQPEEARQAADLAAVEVKGRPDLLPLGLHARAASLLWVGELDMAEALLRSAVDRVRSWGGQEMLPPLLLDLGLCFLLRGRSQPARDHFARALRAAELLGRRRSAAVARYRLVLCDMDAGHTDGMERRLRNLEAESTGVGPIAPERVLGLLDAWLAARQGNADEALRRLGPPSALASWPATPDSALLAERLGAEIALLASGDSPETRLGALELQRAAVLLWRRCGNLRRAGAVERLRVLG